MRIYVASSWRNIHQPGAVAALRQAGHQVYDFRNPSSIDSGFSWTLVDEKWQQWSFEDFRQSLQHPAAQRGFDHDFRALGWCEACLLVLPSGTSSHLEAGWCAGRGKAVAIYVPEFSGPELMYKLFDVAGRTPIFSTLEQVLAHFDG